MVLAAKRVEENGSSSPAVPVFALGTAAPGHSFRSRSDFGFGLLEPRGLEGDGDMGFSPLLQMDEDGKPQWLSQAWILGFLFSKASPMYRSQKKHFSSASES